MSQPTLTINRQCTRCPRVEQTETSVADIVKAASAGKNALPDSPTSLTIKIDDKQVVGFPFLCTPCKQIVARYVEHIAKKPEKQSALRSQTKIEVEEDD